MDPTRRRALRTLAGLPALAAMKPVGATTAAGLAERAIPSSGEPLPVIGIGTWQTFDVGAEAGARSPLAAVVARFAAAGGRVIDSSPMYGSAEAVTGDLVAGAGLTGKLFLATKVWTTGRDAGIRQMETSFKRMGAARMDLMQVHNLVDAAVHTRTLQDWKAKGRVRYIGITHYTRSAYAEIERLLKTRRYDFLQVNYSLAEPDSGERLLPLARDLGVAVIANRPFSEGAMFRRVRGKPLPGWAGDIGAASWAQFFLKWIVSHPAVTCAIPGTGNPDHMADNLAAGTGALPDAAMRARMSAHFESL